MFGLNCVSLCLGVSQFQSYCPEVFLVFSDLFEFEDFYLVLIAVGSLAHASRLLGRHQTFPRLFSRQVTCSRRFLRLQRRGRGGRLAARRFARRPAAHQVAR